jgi:ferrous iron transport protein A
MDAEQPLEPGVPAGHPELLSEAAVGTRVRIETLPSHAGLRDRLLALGIRPGVQVEVLRRGRPGGILHLAHGLLEFMLRQEHARQITVTPGTPEPDSGAVGTDPVKVIPRGRP